MSKYVFLFFILMTNTKSYACRCQNPNTVDESFSYTQTIIHGKVLKKSFVSFQSSMDEKKAEAVEKELKEDKQDLLLLHSKSLIKINLKKIECFKGEIKSDTIIIFTTRTNASCGFTRFEKGKEYITYASSNSYSYYLLPLKNHGVRLEKENTYWTNHCTRTTEFNIVESNELRRLTNNE